MQVTLDIPDTLAAQLGPDPARAALETLLVEAYRDRRVSEEQLRRSLGLDSRFDVHAVLKRHCVPLDYTIADLDHDMETLERMFPVPATTAA